MRYPKLVTIIFCLLLFVFVSVPGYGFFRDDMDHKRIIREVEEKRQESKERFKKEQEKRELEQKEKIKTQESITEEAKEVEKVTDQSKPHVGIMIFLILFLGLGGYLFYRHKRENS